MPLPKETAELIKLARTQGWSVDRTTSGHMQLKSPNGKIVHTSGTPSDWRTPKNFRMQLKRAGLKDKVEPMRAKKLKQAEKVEYFKMPDLPEVAKQKNGKLMKGTLRPAVVEALERLGAAPSGRAAEDLLLHVQTKVPGTVLRQVSQALNNMEVTGKVVRVSPGRFNLYDGPPQPKVRKVRGKKEADGLEDMAVLEEVLAALGKMEKLVKKHQEIAERFQKLGTLLSGVKGG